MNKITLHSLRSGFLICMMVLGTKLSAQSLYFPPLVGTTWDTISPTSLGWCDDKIDSLLNYLGDRNSKAFILLKDGKIVIEEYYGSFTIDSAWYWASAGKSLTGFMVGLAQQQGYLSISDTTSDYLGTGWTNCTAVQEEKITIRHQLTMTTGLDDGVADYTCWLPSCLQYLADPGTRWAYHNGPYTLLDSVIEVATGQNLNTYTYNELGVNTGIYGLYVTSGYNHVFYSKPRAMARFGLLALNQGNWNGNQIMTDTAYFNDMINTSQNLNESYGYLWWLNGKSSFMVPASQMVFPGPLNPNAPNDMFAAVGKNGQVINVVPSMNLVFIRMGNQPYPGGAVSLEFNDTIWQYLNDVMCNVSIEENAWSEKINIYPNPVEGNEFTVQSEVEIDHVEIFDLKGKWVQGYIIENKSKSVLLQKPNISTGMYVIGISTGNGKIYRKIIF
jgi:CubicO group peptidase (beta-lactamase class C family)